MQRDMEADVKWEQRPVVQASLDDLNMGLVTRFTGRGPRYRPHGRP